MTTTAAPENEVAHASPDDERSEPLSEVLPHLAAEAAKQPDLEDAAHDVLESLLRKATRLRARPRRAWIRYFRGAVARASKFLARTEGRRAKRASQAAQRPGPVQPEDAQEVRREAAAMLVQVVATLPKDDLTLLIRRWWLGHTVGQLALEQTRKDDLRSRNVISTRLRRIRAEVQRRLVARYGAGADLAGARSDPEALALAMREICTRLGLRSDDDGKSPETKTSEQGASGN